MIKAIIFDADGVCIHADRFYAEHFLAQHNLPPGLLQEFWSEVFPRCITGQLSVHKALADYFTQINLQVDMDSYLQDWFAYENKPNQELLDYIQTLRHKGYICALATNQESLRTQYIKQEMGFDKLFDHIFASSELGLSKRNPEFYQALMHKLSLEAKQLLYIDDTQALVDLASQLNIKSHYFKTNQETVEFIELGLAGQ